MLRTIGISTVFKHIIGKLPDGVEVFTALVWIGGFCGETDRELKDEQKA